MKNEAAATVLILAGLASVFGTPQMLMSTECLAFRGRCTRDNVGCTYVGIQGWRRTVPMTEADAPQSCQGVILLPLRWPLFQWTP